MNRGISLEPIAIVGIGCRFPGAPDPLAFWSLLCGGGDAISTVPPDRWDAEALYDPDPAAPGKMNSKCGGFLQKIDEFDSGFFGIAPREADLMDPQQRLLLEVAFEALQDAGIPSSSLARSPTGVFLGLASANYGSLLHYTPANVNAFTNSGGSPCIAANRISYLWDLAGPSISVDTACSSSLVAVHLACQSLWTGESTLALAGGANIILIPGPSISLAKARVLSPDGKCRVFDAAANGFGRGEGAGVVVLKPLSRALADGDSIYAVIRATATQQNGRTNGLMAPSRWAQEAVLRSACQRGEISPGDVQYIEAHSSATPIGDAIELNALANVLKENRRPGNLCSIGSVKTNFGHLEGASGVAGLIKVALMLRHAKLVPSLHYQAPNPHAPWSELPLRVQQTVESWESGKMIAGVSASGYGGVNAHVILESAPPAIAPRPASKPHLLTLSAHSATALRELTGKYRKFVDDQFSDELLGDICFTLSARRAHLPHRLAVIGDSAAELRLRLAAFIDGSSSSDLYFGVAAHPRSLTSESARGQSLRDIAAQYCAGREIEWRSWHQTARPCALGLPTYVFQRQRHWMPDDAKRPRKNLTSRVVQPAAPAGSTQQKLVALWRKILGAEQVGLHDNFFDLGGGSLMAAELFVEIHRIFGVQFMPNVLFEHPTIAKLAELIENGDASAPAPLLVPIRAGAAGSPIFLIAPDHLFHFSHFIKQVNSGHPLFGLQPPYPDGFRQSGISIEDMAAAYLAELKTICPDGPCHLVGFCAGGVIAYEIARRLTASGSPQGLLALIDAPCWRGDSNQRNGRLIYITLRLKKHWQSLRGLSLRQVGRYCAVRARLAVGMVLMPLWKSARPPADPAGLASIANRSAIYRYRPQPFSAAIDLFNASEPYPSPAEDTRLHWQQLSPHVQVHTFPGAHTFLLQPPQVDALAERFSHRLAAAEGELNQRTLDLTDDSSDPNLAASRA